MSTSLKLILVFAFSIWLGALVAGFHQLGSHKGAMEPLKYSPDVPLEKVIGWCIVAGIDEYIGAGATKEQIEEALPDIREGCEDRWLAFSRRWERGNGE